MPKQSFLLVSLKEDKAKQLANVISNDSCRKILDYLGEKEDATETQMAKDLNLPISTIHYNLQHLLKTGIIDVDEFHYSEKGKEVNHYKLANKYIIIAPKTTYGIKEKLKSILPVSLLALIGAGFIQMYNTYFTPSAKILNAAPSPMVGVAEKGGRTLGESMMESAVEEAHLIEPMMDTAADQGARAVMEKAPEVIVNVTQSEANLALWFLFGSLFVITLLIIFELIKSKKRK